MDCLTVRQMGAGHFSTSFACSPDFMIYFLFRSDFQADGKEKRDKDEMQDKRKMRSWAAFRTYPV